MTCGGAVERKMFERKGARLENIKRRMMMKRMHLKMKKCIILVLNACVAKRLDTKFKTVLKIQTLGRARIQPRTSAELRTYKMVVKIVSYLLTRK